MSALVFKPSAAKSLTPGRAVGPLNMELFAAHTDVYFHYGVKGKYEVFLGSRDYLYRTFEPEVEAYLDAMSTGLVNSQEKSRATHFEFSWLGVVAGVRERYRAYCREVRGDSSDDRVINIRRMPKTVPRLSQLAHPKYWHDIVLHPFLLTGGLVLVIAPTGKGKTTTAGALIASRLDRYGGFGSSVEDPPELPFAFEHFDNATFIQHPVPKGATVEKVLDDQLRGFPSLSGGGTILLCGEVQTNLIASACLNHALNGHLVVTTLHAESMEAGLKRFVKMAGTAAGSSTEAGEMLASAIKVVIFQTFTYDPTQEGFSRGAYGGKILVSAQSNSPVANICRDLGWKGLEEQLIQQDIILKQSANIETVFEKLFAAK